MKALLHNILSTFIIIVSVLYSSTAFSQGGLNQLPDLDDYLRQYVNDQEFLDRLEIKNEFLNADTIYWSAETGLLETREFSMNNKFMVPVSDSKIELPFLYMECDTINEDNLRLILRMSLQPDTDSAYELNDVVLIAYLKKKNNFYAITRKKVKELTNTRYVEE